MGAMLDKEHRGRWQLGNLMAPRPVTRNPLRIGELPPAPRAPLRVMINDLLHLIFTQQLPPRAWVAILPARLAPLTVPASQLLGLLPRLRATLLTRLRHIRRRRLRTIPRTRRRPRLQRPQPLLQPPLPSRQPNQKRHARLTTRVINRLSLHPLHTPTIRRTPPRTWLWKPGGLNGYKKVLICRDLMGAAGFEPATSRV